MITSFIPSKVLILLLASCLAWIGLLSLGFMVASGVTVSAGWLVAAALLAAVIRGVVVIVREIRGAALLPDFSAYGERGDGNFDSTGKSTVSRPRSEIMERAFTGRRWVAPTPGSNVRPRKVRSRRTELPGATSFR